MSPKFSDIPAPSQSTESAGFDPEQRGLQSVLVRVVHVVVRAAVGLGLHVVGADLGWLGLADHEVSVAVLDDDEWHKYSCWLTLKKKLSRVITGGAVRAGAEVRGVHLFGVRFVLLYVVLTVLIL